MPLFFQIICPDMISLFILLLINVRINISFLTSIMPICHFLNCFCFLNFLPLSFWRSQTPPKFDFFSFPFPFDQFTSQFICGFLIQSWFCLSIWPNYQKKLFWVFQFCIPYSSGPPSFQLSGPAETVMVEVEWKEGIVLYAGRLLSQVYLCAHTCPPVLRPDSKWAVTQH